jgi:hypothetical protein
VVEAVERRRWAEPGAVGVRTAVGGRRTAEESTGRRKTVGEGRRRRRRCWGGTAGAVRGNKAAEEESGTPAVARGRDWHRMSTLQLLVRLELGQ